VSSITAAHGPFAVLKRNLQFDRCGGEPWTTCGQVNAAAEPNLCNNPAGYSDGEHMTEDVPPGRDLSAAPTASRRRTAQLPKLTPKAMLLTAVLIAVLTVSAVLVLWWPATAGLTGAELITARLDGLKIGLSVGVGSGGIVALYLAWRRQHSAEADLDNRERVLAHQYDVLEHQQEVAAATLAHQERVANDAQADAAARRITELYVKAVEQLGSEKAPVRLGGLYALERLAQDNESQRQTIANVLCGYLRMPFQEKVTSTIDDSKDNLIDQNDGPLQELQVRLTAQRILSEHLRVKQHNTYWGKLDLDLTGARLYNFRLTDTHIGSALFLNTTFVGMLWWSDTTFDGEASFDGAAMNTVSFADVTFNANTSFREVAIKGNAEFYTTRFCGTCTFRDAKLNSPPFMAQASRDPPTLTEPDSTFPTSLKQRLLAVAHPFLRQYSTSQRSSSGRDLRATSTSLEQP